MFLFMELVCLAPVDKVWHFKRPLSIETMETKVDSVNNEKTEGSGEAGEDLY